MKITDLPLGEIPYLAVSRLMGGNFHEPYRTFDINFLPNVWHEDIKAGLPTPLVYWYPQYIDFLYEIAMEGDDPMIFLNDFHKCNEELFREIFEEIHKKLVKLQSNSVRLNHLDELRISNGKVKI
jgi:hypothetical protein